MISLLRDATKYKNMKKNTKKSKTKKVVNKKPAKKGKITEGMAISEIIRKYPKTFEVFMKYNLPCVGCASAHFENIKAIADEFRIDVKKFIDDLNKIAK